MKVISLFNQKGGVGKTTLAATLAAGLALRGHRTLLLDADQQGSLTTIMGLPQRADFMRFVAWANPNDADFVDTRDIVQRIPPDNCPDNLYIVVGNSQSQSIPSTMSMRDIIGNFSRRLRVLERTFDYVVIDTQPSATTLHDAIGLVTDYFIIPTDSEPQAAYKALKTTLQNIEHIREQSLAYQRDKARVLGIIPNKFRHTTALHNHILKNLQKEYGDLIWEPIPLRTNIPEAQLLRTTIMHDKPELSANEHLWRMVDHVQYAMEQIQHEQ